MAPLIRIVLRYITLPLLLAGWILPEEQAELIADPEIVFWITQALGAAAPAVAEGWYFLAKWFGWKT